MDATRATQGKLQYAGRGPAPASVAPAAPSRRFVLFAGGALVALLVPGFVSLGLWQWNKAATKEARQMLLEARAHEPAIELPTEVVDPESLRYRRVVVRGTYDPAHQILIDNRVHQERAGYHVVTPLRIVGSATGAGKQPVVLVNRGWVPAAADRRTLPAIDTPGGEVELHAVAVVPATRFFTLAPEPAADVTSNWQPVWQNLDLARYRSLADTPVQSVILQLDPDAPDAAANPGGFVRDWPRPDERIERHVGYAWQWFGFAAATVAIWLYFLLRPYFPERR